MENWVCVANGWTVAATTLFPLALFSKELAAATSSGPSTFELSPCFPEDTQSLWLGTWGPRAGPFPPSVHPVLFRFCPDLTETFSELGCRLRYFLHNPSFSIPCHRGQTRITVWRSSLLLLFLIYHSQIFFPISPSHTHSCPDIGFSEDLNWHPSFAHSS